MPKLPRYKLEERLNNEEEILKGKGTYFSRADIWKELEITSYTRVIQTERLFVAREYTVDLKAKGFVRSSLEPTPRNLWDHKADIYILDSYPYPTDRSEVGAPVRILWLTPIFHPNIRNGLEAGGDGAICWLLMTEWTNLDTLYGIVRGLELLIESPNTASPLRDSESLAAAKWFKEQMPVLKGPKILERRDLSLERI